MQIQSIARVVEFVRIAGSMALDAQRGTVERSYKQDGAVLTEIDRRVEDYLLRGLMGVIDFPSEFLYN